MATKKDQPDGSSEWPGSGAEEKLILPHKSLLLPATPFQRRMAHYETQMPPPLGTPEAAHLQRLMSQDVAFQLKIKALEARLPHFLNARLKGGSGLPLSELLRWYFQEYVSRLFEHGPGSFPTSFNVIESFLSFNREYMLFDLRDELEHLLSVDDYFRWYDSGDIPLEPSILEAMMTEGSIYSYEMVSDTSSLRISGESEQVLAGVALIRHDDQLSCLLLAGEDPPLLSEEEAESVITDGTMLPGREGITPAEDWTVQDRYLQGHPGFAKVIILGRFDLRDGKHDVRYVHLDNGNSFRVFTDDALHLEGLVPTETAERCRQNAVDGLERYNDLFAALASLIYLPAFFAAHAEKVEDLEVATQLDALQEDKDVQKTIEVMGGESQCVTRRSIRYLPGTLETDEEPQREIKPPDMQFQCEGYWKPIGPLEIGEDRDGNQVFARTWVSRHETWSARSPQSFMLRRRKVTPSGPDPGVIYIQRSPSHGIDVYKVGLTRRTAEVRAAELSSATGVPLPYQVLGKWEVGDCALVEREVHKRLAAFRINQRREFFYAELSLLIRTIDTIIKESSSEP